MAFAKGTKALGSCDRCGLVWKLNRLRYEVIDRKTTRLRVCPDCYDGTHPLDDRDRALKSEAIALRDPRRDQAEPQIHSLSGWNPVRGDIVAIEPAATGWNMAVFEQAAPSYLLWEDGERILWEDGDFVTWG